MAKLRVLLVACSCAFVRGGIYPEGHWDRSKELTAENADSFVKENVDAGKTAPAWNAVVENYHKKSEVVFGDVALSSNQVRSIHGTDQNPGAGGWPTIRYFNKATGYGGEAYKKKTSGAMCDELGPKEEYMQEYVEEIGGVTMCDVKDPSSGCNEQQTKFIEKNIGKPSAELKKQQQRLQGMSDKDGSSMKPEALKWIKQRIGIYKQLSAKEEL